MNFSLKTIWQSFQNLRQTLISSRIKVKILPPIQRKNTNIKITEPLIMGLVQGLTEFLPVSSTAHLNLLARFTGWPKPTYLFATSLHLGTSLSAILYFYQDINKLTKAIVSSIKKHNFTDSQESYLAWLLILANLPVVLLGIIFEKQIETKLRGPVLMSLLLIGFSFILRKIETDSKATLKLNNLKPSQALLIGFAQAISLFPGISRSGSTIGAGLYCGLSRQEAAHFSYLLGIPVFVGSTLFKLRLVNKRENYVNYYLPAFFSSTFSGYFAIGTFLRYMGSHNLKPFLNYRIALGLLILISELSSNQRRL